MAKPDYRRYNNRLVTFLNPADLQRFREMAYQRNQHTAALIREILTGYLKGVAR